MHITYRATYRSPLCTVSSLSWRPRGSTVFHAAQPSFHLFYVVLFSMIFSSVFAQVGQDKNRMMFANSYLNFTCIDPVKGVTVCNRTVHGRLKLGPKTSSVPALLVHAQSARGDYYGCQTITNVPNENWIALAERGGCEFDVKAANAKNASASGIVIYDNKKQDALVNMEIHVDGIVSIFISKVDGEKIASLVDNGTRVMMTISPGERDAYDSMHNHINKTSVLFVSISFIVLMIISLAWLVFYYIQRFRYAHAKERLSKRLMHAAKKAISKMPARTIKNGDRETDADFDQCAICIEGYKVSDVIRVLPCKHVFHKSCVDPWLIEQRSCPMCKTDILMAYGLQIHGSRESIANIEVEGPSTSLGPFEIITTDGLREFDHNGVEVIRFQPAQVDYHSASIEAAVMASIEAATASASSPSGSAMATVEAADIDDTANSNRVSSEADVHEEQTCPTPEKAASDDDGPETEQGEASSLLHVPAASLESLEDDDNSSEQQRLVEASDDAPNVTRNSSIKSLASS